MRKGYTDWFPVVFIIVVALVPTIMHLHNKNNLEFAKSGLEECPNYRSSNASDTIWVKDCVEFTKTFKEK